VLKRWRTLAVRGRSTRRGLGGGRTPIRRSKQKKKGADDLLSASARAPPSRSLWFFAANRSGESYDGVRWLPAGGRRGTASCGAPPAPRWFCTTAGAVRLAGPRQQNLARRSCRTRSRDCAPARALGARVAAQVDEGPSQRFPDRSRGTARTLNPSPLRRRSRRRASRLASMANLKRAPLRLSP